MNKKKLINTHTKGLDSPDWKHDQLNTELFSVLLSGKYIHFMAYGAMRMHLIMIFIY